MVLFPDSAELDPQGTDVREIRGVVEELSRFKIICLCITSRISNVPRHCERPTIPTLSVESACNIYGIFNCSWQSHIVNDLARRLDLHTISITPLATVALDNVWDYDRLVRERDTHRTQALRTGYNENLATTTELSLTSPTFHKLGPSTCDLPSIIAFPPQGLYEVNLDRLFPAISDRANLFNKFRTLPRHVGTTDSSRCWRHSVTIFTPKSLYHPCSPAQLRNTPSVDYQLPSIPVGPASKKRNGSRQRM